MSAHPDDELLRLFAVGRLNEAQGDEIEAHIAACQPCVRRLDDIERKKSDPLIRKMRAAHAESSGDFTPGVLLGNYRLETQLGRGGMGEAWKAWDDTAKRHVVLKFVPKDVQNINEAMDAVGASFQKVHALQHSHICPLYVLDNDSEHGYFVVMKFIDGLPLDVYCRQHGPIPFDEIIRILRDVADALDYAHGRKVIHRDVKPSNIMVGDADGVQLIDFGLADEICAGLTRTEDVSDARITGTRAYMAPEQWRGGKQDARTDQYALAVTAYELLAGHVPFNGTDTEILKNAVLTDPPPTLADQPEHVNAALFRGLTKNRNDRFDNCRAFVDALAHESQPPRLPPPLPSVKVKSVPWNRNAQAVIVSILLLCLVAFVLIRLTGKPVPKPDTALNVKPVAESGHITENVPQTDPARSSGRGDGEIQPPLEASHHDALKYLPTKEDFNLSKYLAVGRNQRSGMRPVVRITMILDEKGWGRLLVKRGYSAEPLPAFKGTQFDSNTFPGALTFHGDNHSVRYLFPNGDVSRQSVGHSFAQQSPPPGWEYDYYGGSYDGQRETMRFSLQRNESRAGFTIGKIGSGLPCVLTFELLDNKDDPPFFETVLYDQSKQIAYTLTCWGEKEENDRLRISAACSRPRPGMEAERTPIAENVVVEKSMSLFKQFKLPPEAVKNVNMVKYGLLVRRSTGPMNRMGFDLSLFDMCGCFESDVGQG